MSAPFDPKNVVYRPLTRAALEDGIKNLDMKKARRVADHFVGDLQMEGRDLLNDAVCRALISRQCRNEITVAQFVVGIMRSIASTARRSRERRREEHVHLPVTDISERLALAGYVVQSPAEAIEAERIRDICADTLERLAAGSPLNARLIDGIGLGLRGDALAKYLNITSDELATVRRALKRQVQRIWPEVEAKIEPTPEAD